MSLRVHSCKLFLLCLLNPLTSQYTKDVQKQAAVDGVKLLMIDDLFSIEQ